MYVCLCTGVTDHDIQRAAQAGCRDMAELTLRTGCSSQCGSCRDMATDLLARAQVAGAFPLPILASAA